MKAYILKEEDFALLRAKIAGNPEHGQSGHSSQVLSHAEKEAFKKAHRFYNYVIERWIDSVRE